MSLVSALVPAYNTMKYLPETLASILAQTYSNFEVIIVNDGSTDNILEWAEQITDSRVRVISQVNQGLAAARNSGLREAKGEYIAYLDGDDLWHPTKLAKQVEMFEKNPEIGLVYTWVERIDASGKSLGKPFKIDLEGNIWEKLTEKNVIAPSSAMIRRSCFELVGKFDPSLQAFGEDWDMWLRIAAAYRVRVIPETLCSYRECPSSASKNWQAMAEGLIRVIERTFATASPQLMPLKQKSCGFTYLYVASRSLQSNPPNYAIASGYLQQAITHNPQLKLSKEYLRLSLTVWLMKWLGLNTYNKLRDRFRLIRSYLVSMS
ncbi:MAG: glycosyltransferase family 2 protein [Pleurocapsa sp.]